MADALPDIPYGKLDDNLRAHLLTLQELDPTPWNIASWIYTHTRLIEGHGTRGRYQGHRRQEEKGCRCDMCKKAQSVHNTSPERKAYRRMLSARKKREALQFEIDLTEDDEL